VADALGFAAQAVALAIGRIVVVQPLLATTVVFALPLGAKLDKRRLSRTEILGAVAVVGGVAAFLVVTNPTGGVDNPELGVWLVSGAVCARGVGVSRAAPARAPARVSRPRSSAARQASCPRSQRC
jgi:drug/metabolite transporter (DMT)-like permease